ncbi:MULTISPECIES: orotate phosphoribosyltransferase [Methanobacterium]|uniref:Orotate phosphoribosyltransferase n=1 Tax=Methanobacterium formicicum TaxID=2162 RepID=A0A843AP30_METFO|nr:MULTISPECIES: orotate phosphoribosyltransferase [Methanobacterium]MBF4475576.1 orotate phosphoribosyltransferase [Methanobacterium formicicum]MDD4810153.1 orotate phosphoribosyltransferase [Methanobacterium formicicum]MDG3547817.1 orotate phosphoribosyltransferase [Methanobacterium formicicum]MDH2659824.1 orotate phosphoribosyltransferase [Methanobacterium formicicum]
MEVRGLCSICGQPGKMYTCSLCGNLVCEKCFQQDRGVCQRCQRGTRFKNRNDLID